MGKNPHHEGKHDSAELPFLLIFYVLVEMLVEEIGKFKGLLR